MYFGFYITFVSYIISFLGWWGKGVAMRGSTFSKFIVLVLISRLYILRILDFHIFGLMVGASGWNEEFLLLHYFVLGFMLFFYFLLLKLANFTRIIELLFFIFNFRFFWASAFSCFKGILFLYFRLYIRLSIVLFHILFRPSLKTQRNESNSLVDCTC